MNIASRRFPLFLCCSWLLFCSGCAINSQQEPCATLAVPVKKDDAFVHWLINEEEGFKRKGCWLQHVELGDEAIEIARKEGDKAAVMTLSIQLASTWFYLGNPEKCKELALSAHGIAIEQGDRKSEVTSLYLLSAAERAQNNIQAVKTAEHALALCTRYLPDEQGLKAKVLYNLAAAESDIKPAHLNQAEEHLREAAVLFEKAGKDYDVLRVGLRLARVEYQQGSYSQAEKTVKALRQYTKSPREEMIYYYQLAKIQHRQKKWQLAGESGSKASEIAKKLNAKN